ncbi:MAG TPA: amidohydrolase family protein [Rhizomicrobium sp.]
MAPVFSPDGSKIAFLNFDGAAGHASASVAVADVATGDITIVHNSLFGPGPPTWSPDGKWLAVAVLMPYSKKYREGTNQLLVMSASGPKDASQDKIYAPISNVSIDTRSGSGPAWSPDGKYMAVVYGAQISLVPVSPNGEPIGPLKRAADDTAYSPSWSRDGREILFESDDKLKILDVASGKSRTIPVALTYAQYVPKTQYVLHVGKLVDGVSPAAHSDMDIVINGNRIAKLEPHVAGRRAIELPELTAMPGLIDAHTHRSANFGEQQGRALLAWGVTTLRSPGGTPYFAAEDREASDAGIRVEPRIFDTGYLLDGSRIFYSDNVSISSDAHLERELVRTRDLGFDFFKTYVRLPNQMQKRVVEFGHKYGMPSTSHELYPAALDGIDSVEHQGATSRRGYSLKNIFNHSYEDVTAIFGQTRMTLTPTVFPGFRNLLDAYPELRSDPRLDLDPGWLKASMLAPARTPPPDISGICKMVLDVQRAGGRIVAGTDMNDGMYMQAELYSYVKCGMSPYDALRAATVTPAELLNFDGGSIQPGKLADIVLVEGNPLEDIANTRHIKRVIANGRMFMQEDLLSGKAKDAPR